MAAGAASLACHLLILWVLFSVRAGPATAPPPPMVVGLVRDQTDAPRMQPTVSARTPDAAAPRPPLPRRHASGPPPPDVDPLPAVAARADGVELSAAQIAGAANAGSGSGSGGVCDMARRVEAALRKDPLAQAAVAGSAGKAIMVWNGDWVRNGGEDGKGLAAVREAILWEVAFAPEPCRAQPVHGLVLLSPSPAPGSARLAVGLSDWRWSDLLGPRAPSPDPASRTRP